MKRIVAALALAGVLCAGTAQAEVEVFFAHGAMEEAKARQLMELTRREFPDEEWTAVFEEEESLRDRVLSDHVPQMAVCAPSEAEVWAREGLLMPLEAKKADSVQKEILDACVSGEKTFLLPLLAQHRQMAVNRRLMDQEHLGYMIGIQEHPVWYPAEFDQILEEFTLSGEPGMDIWPAEPGTSAALEALIQSIYGGVLTEDGDNSNVQAGLLWLRDRVANGMISVVPTREAALERFLAGKTAIFLDWTPQEALNHGEKMSGGELAVMPYPTSYGMPVRSFEVTGVCVFDTEEKEAAARAAAFWDEDSQAQRILGERAIWEDDALWLPVMTGERAVLHGLFCAAMNGVISGRTTPDSALYMVEEAMKAL